MNLVPSYEAAVIVQEYFRLIDSIDAVPRRIVTDAGTEAGLIHLTQVSFLSFFIFFCVCVVVSL